MTLWVTIMSPLMYLCFVFFPPDNRFCCYVFKAANPDKAYALALSISKAFYLACQILQEQQGNFPATPERDILFEPQKDNDTKVGMGQNGGLSHYDILFRSVLPGRLFQALLSLIEYIPSPAHWKDLRKTQTHQIVRIDQS